MRSLESKYVNGSHTDDRRRPIAVAVEIVEGAVERLAKVALHPRDQLEKILLRDLVPLNGLGKRWQNLALVPTILHCFD